MPLVRYEVRCEHSLANPELFRSAARDDPEGLLEGVAMAGLVGIVRQLGDLAEFAAEVFRDLHGELTAVGGRAHDLTVRVQQLEAELPSVEKALLSEPNQLRFAYTNGADWHASIRSDQNHCTSGELPRFVRNFYEECRGPPRLFLLDKFDVAGSGACLKRYTDPSFFKLEWASSELMKAQRAQRDKKARREKKKGRRRKTGQPIAAINQIPARVRYGSASLDDLDSLSHLLASTLKDEVASSSSIQAANHGPGTQSQRRSNLGPKTKVVGGSLPPTGALASLAVGGPSKPLKISAKDIEANTSGKFYQPSEPESVAQSMAGKISKIIEMEDRDAVPSAGLIPRNVDYKIPKGKNGSKMSDSDVEIKTANRVTKKDLEAAAMARTGRTSRGTSRSNTSMDAREGSVPGNWRTSQSSMPHVTSRSNGSVDFKEGGKFANTRASQISMPDVSPRGNVPSDAKEGLDSGVLGTASSNIPVSTELPGLQASSPRTSSLDVRDPMQSSEEVSRGTVDVKEALDASAGFSRQNPGGSNAPATSISEAFSGIEGVKEQVDEINGSEDRHGDSHRSLKPSQQHDRAHEHSFSPTVEQLQSLPNHGDVAPASDPAHGVDMQRRHSPTEAPAGDRASPFSANASEDSAMSAPRSDLAIHDGHRSDVQRVTNSAVNGRQVASNLEETVYKQPYLPPIRIEEIVVDEGPQMKSVASPALSSQCSSPGENLRPSTSMLSRLSYSSELVSVTSGSELDSPVSPKSPAFNGLYLPPGSPSNISAAMSESPPEIYMGLYLRSAHHSDDSSPRHEIPVLSLSPKSPSASPFPVPWADDGDHAGPLRPPPPLPVTLPVTLPVSIPIPEDSSHFERKQVFNSAEPQFRPATSPEPNGLPSQSNGGPGYFTNLQENAEVHAEHASRTPVNPDLQESSTSNRDPGAYFGAPSAHVEQMHLSGAYLDAEVPPLSTTSSFTPEPSSSPVGLTDSSTMQSSQQRFALSSPQNSPESRNVDVPSDAPTSSTDSAIPPVEGSEADPVSQTCQDPISNPSFTDFVRSSLILPPRPSDSPSSSAHTSPLGSPKQRFQRIFLTNPSAQPVPSPLGQAMNNAPPDFSVKDEESEPSSPTGSVIIKDTPSAPGSPASIYSESDSEIHEFHPPYDEPKGSVSPRAVAHALEDIVNHGKSSSCEINGQEDRRFKSSQSGPIGAVNIQDSGLLNSASEELDSLPRDHVEVPAPHTSPHNDISHEETSFLASPPTSPHLDSGRASPRHGTEAAALRPISTTWSAPKSQNSSASNSPPDSPPKKEHLAGEDEAATLDWKDSTAKAEITRVPSTSPGRSPSNSPPTSPPKFSGRTSSLRWRKRSAPAPPEPDFSLPPNLVCRSETSSPPCSPPPHSDSESPKQWDEGSEISSSSSSSDSSRETQSEAPNVEIYRLPDSPLPPDSPTMSEEGDGNSSGSSSSSSECDEEEDATAAEYEDGRVQKTTLGLALQHPSPSSSDHKPPFEIPSSEPGVSNGNHQPSETPLRPASSFESSEESALPDSLSPQVVDITQQLSALDSQMNVSPTTDALEPPPHPLPLAPAMSTETPDTKDALAAAIAHHDWNMMKALTFQDPGHRPVPPPDERSILLDQIRTNSFSMRRTDSMERKDPLTRPSANINVAAILEKANAIRQAFVGSDDEDGDGDDWSDS